ncbi:hypothetical protein HYH03_010015 [Edaphochlamys debaryana]|uniref:peptide-methionine (S)-S-oxide reductase n=1 Tax=Edaphochlamys debaryana TaxID=47281 RepID=A0A835Y316_9CHLO|nr:hypothetical protein HYH03_010015 [Edaphochlamys debaryana]|eukprot:KAG2491645.1 hypothetical protein HYH03_010015 [Edaphochlamys debaryana]
MLLARPGLLSSLRVARKQAPAPLVSQPARQSGASELVHARTSVRSLTSSPVPASTPSVVAGASPATAPAGPTASPPSSGGKMEVATLGGGCFWCVEACYNMLQGVSSAISGYAAGNTKDPNYKQICTGTSGHAEVVQITYDPSIVSYKEILQIFFTIHDPTTKDRQGNDVGTQYRSIILTHNEQQAAIAKEVMQEVASEGWYSAPLVTQVEPLTTFYPAEDYHQNYFVQNPGQGYCRAVVGPKVAKFRAKFAGKLRKA